MASSFKADCEKYFGTNCLYTILGLKKRGNWSNEQLKTAYYRAARAHHPDRCESEDKKEATAKFQLINKAFSVLSNEGKRKLYDRTGGIDDDEMFESDNWFNEWGRVFHVITLEEIEAYKKSYQGSAEELGDVKGAYIKHKGDMDKIMQCVLFADYEEEPRIREIIGKLIKDGEVEPYDIFVNEPPRKAKKRLALWKRERAEFERSSKDGGQGSSGSLVATIRSRQRARLGFLEELEQRYANADETASKKTANRQKGKKGSQQADADKETLTELKGKRARATASSQVAPTNERIEENSKGDQAKKKNATNKRATKRKDDANELTESKKVPEKNVRATRTKKQEGDTKGKVEGENGDEEPAPTVAKGRKRPAEKKKEEVGTEAKTKKSSDKNAVSPKLLEKGEADKRPEAPRGRKKTTETEEQSSGQGAAAKMPPVVTTKAGSAGGRTNKIGKGRKREVELTNGLKSEDVGEPSQGSTSAPARTQKVASGGTKKKGRKAGD